MITVPTPLVPFLYVQWARLSPSLQLQILENCSPFDLAQLAATPSIRNLILSNPHIWKCAFDNLRRGQCSTLPTRPACVGRSDGAYAHWIFGGGECEGCRKFTSRLVFDFALDFRACSTWCRNRVELYLKYIDHDNGIASLPWVGWLPQVKDSRSGCFKYKRDTLAAVQAQWPNATNLFQPTPGMRSLSELNAELAIRVKDMPLRVENAQKLEAWLPGYIAEKSAVRAVNLAFIGERSQEEGIRVDALLRTPTLGRVFGAFNRDLEPLTLSVWRQYRRQIRAEAKVNATNVSTKQTVRELDAKLDPKTKCLYCPRFFTVDGMPRHIVSQHRDRDPDQLLVRPAAHQNRVHCRDCSGSNRVFTAQGLEMHRRDKHV